MTAIADVTGACHGAGSKLPLQREHVLLRVGDLVRGAVGRNPADRNVLRPVDIGIGIGSGNVQWCEADWKWLAEILAGGSCYERIVE